jgi:hypothetical protein
MPFKQFKQPKEDEPLQKTGRGSQGSPRDNLFSLGIQQSSRLNTSTDEINGKKDKKERVKVATIGTILTGRNSTSDNSSRSPKKDNLQQPLNDDIIKEDETDLQESIQNQGFKDVYSTISPPPDYVLDSKIKVTRDSKENIFKDNVRVALGNQNMTSNSEVGKSVKI